VIKICKRAGFVDFWAMLFEAKWCGIPNKRSRYIMVASVVGIGNWFLQQVAFLPIHSQMQALFVIPFIPVLCQCISSNCFQKRCQGPCPKPCHKCWMSDEAFPGHVCLNLGSSKLSKPAAHLEVACFTTSNIDDLLLLPVSHQAAKDMRPGMAHNLLAEALLVRVGALYC
jgi:hypothetical protein